MEFQPRGDNFRLTLDTQELARGMRPSKRMPRNSGYLIQSSGAVGRDGVLQVLDPLSSLDLSFITDGFPYPQIFIFPSLIIACGETEIYEYESGAFVLKITASAGNTWAAISYGNFVYLSNGTVSIVRDSQNMSYALSDLPTASCICDFNGQVIIGDIG